MTTFTPNLNLALITPNDVASDDTWGTTPGAPPPESLNEEFIIRYEEALCKVEELDIGAAGSPFTYATAEDARFAVLELTGALGSNKEVVLPALSHKYVIVSKWTGSFNVTITSNGNSLTPLEEGEIIIVYTDGTTIREMSRTPILIPVGVPEGVIMMWTGSPSTLPTGWQLCDGSEILSGPLTGQFTPNLNDRFIIAGHDFTDNIPKTNIEGSLLQTGGQASVDSSSDGAFAGNSGGTSITIGQMPSHYHEFFTVEQNVDTAFVSNIQNNQKQNQTTEDTGSAGSGQAHNHSVSLPAHTHTGVSNISPYFALAFIMKI